LWRPYVEACRPRLEGIARTPRDGGARFLEAANEALAEAIPDEFR